MDYSIFVKPKDIANITLQEKIERCILLEPYINQVKFSINNQIIHRVELTIKQQRYYHVIYPSTKPPTALIIWLHGSRQDALITSIYSSDLINNIEKYNYCLVLPQAHGVRKSAHQHSKYSNISFGKMYWEIRDQVEQFEIDKQFISAIIDREAIDDVHLLGFSNGGVFACLMAIHLRDKLKSVVSFAGGIGHDAHAVFDPRDAPENSQPIRLILITGEKDSHYLPTIAAKNIFEDFDYKPELYVIDGLAHKYRKSEEKIVLELLYK